MTEDTPPIVTGQRKHWSGDVVTAIGQAPGWVFVQPGSGSAARPFAVAYAAWAERPVIGFSRDAIRSHAT